MPKPFDGVDRVSDYDAHAVISLVNQRMELSRRHAANIDLTSIDALGILDGEIIQIVRDQDIDARRDRGSEDARVLHIPDREGPSSLE